MFIGAIALFIAGLDRLTKIWAVHQLKGKSEILVLGNFFQLVYVENRGVAFGLLSKLNFLLPVLTLALIAFLIVMARKYKKKEKKALMPLTFILGGAVGNLIDRLTTGYVVDFFSFNFGNYHFPVFNVADIFVTLGTFFLLIFFIREEEEASSMKDS